VIGAVVLAAGAASRYGSPKQRLFLPRVLEALRATAVEEVVVVAGAHQIEANVRVVYSAEWERGPGASLRSGLAGLQPGVEAAVVVLADGPDLDPRAVDRVIEVWRAGGGDLLAATYDGVNRSHPVLIGLMAWDRIPDAGARHLATVLVPCRDLRPPGDVDVPPAR